MQKEELGRRAVLMGAGCAALAFLGACGAGDGGESATTQPNGTGPLANAGDVPVGGGVVTSDNVLVLQLTAGNFTAFSAICTHQSFRIQAPNAEGVITCRGHDSHFNASDGSVIDGPAPRGLVPINVKLDGDNVVRA